MKPLLTAVLLLFFCNCFSQKNGNPHSDQKLITDVKYLKINDDVIPFAKSNFLRFTTAVVKDVRFDTTNIGTWFQLHYYAYVGYIGENRKINFKNGLSRFMQNCLQASLVTGINDTSLVCFIKEFHINRKDTLKASNAPDEVFCQLKADIECYYNINQKLYPALKIDTTIIDVIKTEKRKVDDLFNENFFSEFFNAFCNKINRTNIRKVIQRSSSDSISLINKYNERFNLPILKNNTYQPGVYLTFSEFKNNKPSVTNYKAKTTSKLNLSAMQTTKSTALFDSFGNIINSLEIFGYCDGKQLWISFGNFYFPFVRIDNGFEFYVTLTSNVRILADLNMESGKPY
jgi:hypothetical protein